uniref:Neuronal pentraxin receptor b n=1 Tax=Scophthalmus maximus TaxID=52904 RepID=A0A8D3BI94_SCOMX
MKFVVVLVGAGSLAFLGAVICIVASVYPRKSAAPLGDNGTLTSEPPLDPLEPGSVAHAGPLGALHGTAGAGAGAGGGGSDAKHFTAAQQADEPLYGAGDEDWTYLRTTAEELRQTVLQQNDQILMDQRTIRELTGKLSECESGLEDERTVPERSVGVWSGNRRVMAGDGVSSSTAAQLQTARAVEDRRPASPASPAAPAAPKHPSKNTPGRGKGTWRVEDLDGELERKIKMLEKERQAMRKETQGQHEKINQGLDTANHRVTELEHMLTEPSFPDGFVLSFPMRTNYMYGLVRKEITEMYAFTACVWLKAKEGGIGTPFSYSVPGQPNELVLLQGVHNPVELLINDKVAQLPLSLPQDEWQHICVSWTLRDGVWKAYQGGKMKGRGEGLAAWHPIKPGGVLILGQEQDTLGGRFDASQALVGELSQFNLWDRVLKPAEVAAVAECSSPALGNIAPWTDLDVDVYGGATKESLDPWVTGRSRPRVAMFD